MNNESRLQWLPARLENFAEKAILSLRYAFAFMLRINK
jgi:hypothetical protein